MPIVAGGTFFYVDALLGKIETPEVPPNEALRAELETKDASTLYAEICKKDPRRAKDIDQYNKRRLVRALEIADALGAVPVRKPIPLFDVLTIGIETPIPVLNERIHKRIVDRIDVGMTEEVKHLHSNGLTYERMHDLGLEYRYIAKYLQKELTKEEMIEQLAAKTRQFAKRQRSWLRRTKTIHWTKLEELTKTETLVKEFLKD